MDQHFIAQEASVEAVNLRDLDKAIYYSSIALEKAPKNPVLHGNYAMNLLVSGKSKQALEAIKKGLEVRKDDRTNQHIKNLIESVISGKRNANRSGSA